MCNIINREEDYPNKPNENSTVICNRVTTEDQDYESQFTDLKEWAKRLILIAQADDRGDIPASGRKSSKT